MKYRVRHMKLVDTFLWDKGPYQCWGGYKGSIVFSEDRKNVATLPIDGEWVEVCEECNGTLVREWTIGGDGYGNRCCGEMDVEGPCEDCNGKGIIEPERIEDGNNQ